MKKLIPLLIFLIPLITSIPLYAQTRAAKAPMKKKVVNSKPASSISSTPKPASSAPSTLNRTNSDALPTAKPSPSPAQPSIKVSHSVSGHSSGRRISRGTLSSGGYGYEKGNNLLNIGVGLSSYYYGNPIGASFEAGIDKDISVGAQVDYNSGNYGDYYYNSSRWRYTSTYFGVRGSYHVNRLLNIKTAKVDLYAGLGLGYRSFRWNDSNYGYGYDYSSGLFLNYFIGGKYYFSDKIGAFLELGYTGLSSSRVGLAVKF